LLNYIISGWQPGGRDVIFVPVALNYDHVLEDRFLIKADKTGVRRFRPPLGAVLLGLGGHVVKRLTGRFNGFGTASVSFGKPFSLSEEKGRNPAIDARMTAQVLMARVRAVMPVLPVPLVASVLIDGVGRTEADISARVEDLLERLRLSGTAMPRRDAAAMTRDALVVLRERGLVQVDGGVIRVSDDEQDVLAYYARSIAYLFETGDTVRIAQVR
jgi:glycerol-3-phosphate O-acyltransferase